MVRAGILAWADSNSMGGILESATALAREEAMAMLKILFATDGFQAAQDATAFLERLPLPAKTPIRLVVVRGTAEDSVLARYYVPPRFQEAERRWAEDAVSGERARLARHGWEVTTQIRAGEAAHEILRAADEFEASLILIGANNLNRLETWMLGSVSRNVAKHARQPVLVARPLEHGLERVLLALDGSQHACEAIEFLARLPLPDECRVLVAHVVRPFHADPMLAALEPVATRTAAEETLRERRLVGEHLVSDACVALEHGGKRASSVLREGDPAREITNLATEIGADLIVAGARGVSLIEGLVVGSVADRLLKGARRSVLLVR